MILAPSTTIASLNTTTVSTVAATKKAYPKTITGPDNNTAQTEAIYKLTEYKSETGLTAEQQVQIDTDKENIKWVFRVYSTDSNGFSMNLPKEHILIGTGNECVIKAEVTDSETDFTKVNTKDEFKEVLESKGFLYAKVEIVEEAGKKINKLTIKFSKWLDAYELYVEPFRDRPERTVRNTTNDPAKNFIKKTSINANPEVIDAYWLNDQGKRITSIGFESDIKFYIETLGLTNKLINLRLFDYDGIINPADHIPWNDGQQVHQCVIENRRFTQDYYVEELDATAYENAQSWVDGDLDVYINLELQDSSIAIDLDNRYANIQFLTSQNLEPFLAKREEVVVNAQTYIQYNPITTVFPGMTAYLVAKATNITGSVTLSVYEESPLLTTANTKLSLLNANNEPTTDFTGTITNNEVVVPVKFQELDSQTYNTWNTLLDNESEEGLFSKLIIKTVKDGIEYLNEDEFKLKSSVIRYIIKSDGITKYHRDISSEVRYIFKDNQDNLHFLLKRDSTEINWVSRDKKDRLVENYIYKKNKIKLIKIKEGDFYSSGAVKFKFLEFQSNNRSYIDSDCLACLLAAMIENQIEDLRFNGFSTSTGTSGSSQSHWNGMVGDLGYLNVNKDGKATWLSLSSSAYSSNPNWSHNADFDYDRQVLFNNSLYKYGFSKFKRLNNNTLVKMLSENFIRTINEKNETKSLPHTSHYRTTKTFHFHHLHLQGLDLSFIEIKE